MRVSDSRRRPARKTTAAIAAAIAVTIAVSGCASGDDVTTPTAPVPASAAPAQDDQCGGMGTDPAAAITRSADIDIDAPVERVWDVQTDVAKWNRWQEAVLTIERLDSGPFSATSRFRWTTPVPESRFSPADTLTITSSVTHVEPRKCVIWEGPATGTTITIDRGTHLWVFTETDRGTHVHTRESWDAPLLDSLQGPDRDAVAAMLGGGLDIWLRALKTEVETPAS